MVPEVDPYYSAQIVMIVQSDGGQATTTAISVCHRFSSNAAAFKGAGLAATFDPVGLFDSRGLYIAHVVA